VKRFGRVPDEVNCVGGCLRYAVALGRSSEFCRAALVGFCVVVGV